MSFMQAQMTKKLEWLEVDGPMGTEWVDLEDVGEGDVRRLELSFRIGSGLPPVMKNDDGKSRELFEKAKKNVSQFLENSLAKIHDFKIVKGYGVRSSAPGYLDATPWTVYRSAAEARKAYAAEKRAVRGEDH